MTPDDPKDWQIWHKVIDRLGDAETVEGAKVAAFGCCPKPNRRE